MKPKKTFIIAEVSANHAHNIKNAILSIKEAKKAGADAIKFQTYTPDTLTLNCSNKYFRIKHPKWGGQILYELYKKAYTPWSWFKKLKKVADSEGITFFSTAFDKTSVDFLEELGVPMHKIASFELVDLDLITYAAKTKKPLIMSTGMANLEEIKEAVDAARKAGTKDLTLLKCVSSYPAKPQEMNLLTIPDIKKRFNVQAGLSDHSLGIGVSVAAVALGAEIIEKHFTLSHKIKTVDSFFSIDPKELKQLVDNIRTTNAALGCIRYGLTDEEKKNIFFRRSLFAAQNIKKGELLNDRNIRSVRPSSGLKPKYLKKILGRKAKKNISAGTPLSWELIK